MVSKASEDLPDPETPVTTVRVLWGTSKSTSFRLWTRAPRTTMLSVDIGLPERGSRVELRRDTPGVSAAATESFYYKGKLFRRVPAALAKARRERRGRVFRWRR